MQSEKHMFFLSAAPGTQQNKFFFLIHELQDLYIWQTTHIVVDHYEEIIHQ